MHETDIKASEDRPAERASTVANKEPPARPLVAEAMLLSVGLGLDDDEKHIQESSDDGTRKAVHWDAFRTVETGMPVEISQSADLPATDAATMLASGGISAA